MMTVPMREAGPQSRGGQSRVGGLWRVQFNNHDKVSAKAPDTKLTHQPLLLLVTFEAKKTQRLVLAALTCQQNVEPDDRAKTGTEHMQCRPQFAQVGAIF